MTEPAEPLPEAEPQDDSEAAWQTPTAHEPSPDADQDLQDYEDATSWVDSEPELDRRVEKVLERRKRRRRRRLKKIMRRKNRQRRYHRHSTDGKGRVSASAGTGTNSPDTSESDSAGKSVQSPDRQQVRSASVELRARRLAIFGSLGATQPESDRIVGKGDDCDGRLPAAAPPVPDRAVRRKRKSRRKRTVVLPPTIPEMQDENESVLREQALTDLQRQLERQKSEHRDSPAIAQEDASEEEDLTR